MLCLLTCPPAYLRLREEVDTASKASRLSSPIATDAEARSLPYLEAVLREAIRVHPPSIAPSKLTPVQRKKSSSLLTVCGYLVPGGTQIGANIPGMLRSREIFGPDAECFRPERWLQEGDLGKLSQMKSTVDLVFGAGKFQCMGRGIAWMETRKLVLEVSFTLSLDSPHPYHVS